MQISNLHSGTSGSVQRGGVVPISLPPARRDDGGSDDAPKAEAEHAHHRPNPLVNAMMEALKGLMPANAAPATPAAPAPAAATEAAAAAPALDLKEAASAFAHALFQALQGGRGEGKEGGGEHHHKHRHHDHGDGERVRAYGGLAQRLEGLAQALTPAAAPATPATPAMPATPATPAAPATPATPAAPAPAAESPLLKAFKNLLTALNPTATGGADSAQQKLAGFLHQMAQALTPMAESATTGAPTTGGLLNVSA
jgi:hypothetical protein